jgi:hypothetical protein
MLNLQNAFSSIAEARKARPPESGMPACSGRAARNVPLETIDVFPGNERCVDDDFFHERNHARSRGATVPSLSSRMIADTVAASKTLSARTLPCARQQ